MKGSAAVAVRIREKAPGISGRGFASTFASLNCALDFGIGSAAHNRDYEGTVPTCVQKTAA